MSDVQDEITELLDRVADLLPPGATATAHGDGKLEIQPPPSPFEIQTWESHAKSIHVKGPEDLYLYVDFDDVDHEAVEPALKRMVAILNEHWS